MRDKLVTAESVCIGHPDKVADQLSDAYLDACLEQDKEARVDCQALITSKLIVLAGEVTAEASFSPQQIVESTLKDVGYTSQESGFDYKSSGLICNIHPQSKDIARAVVKDSVLVASDQGIIFGYATDETKEFMPLPHVLARMITDMLVQARATGSIPFLLPDGKVQVTVEYGSAKQEARIHTIIASVQHREHVTTPELQERVRGAIIQAMPCELIDSNTIFLINPGGRFVIGGPQADTGLTGRKQMVDCYGVAAAYGGGAFSGKDPTKIDRSGAYMARFIAKNIVAANAAKRCQVQLVYAIGLAKPLVFSVDTFGTGTMSDEKLSKLLLDRVDLRPEAIIDRFNLRRPIYKKTAYGGHFGRADPEFTWESIDCTSIF